MCRWFCKPPTSALRLWAELCSLMYGFVLNQCCSSHCGACWKRQSLTNYACFGYKSCRAARAAGSFEARRQKARRHRQESMVSPVFGRKFLGYCLRRWSGDTVKIAVAP
jgi:hypothetical protein